MSALPAADPDIRAFDLGQRRREHIVVALLCAVVFLLFALTLSVGSTVTPPADVAAALVGFEVPGASFVVRDLRFPRALVSLTCGLCFGLGGATFQTMLRNPLASPDIIGISSGASAAAVFAIVVLSLQGTVVSLVAVAAGLAVAALIYILSFRDGVVGARLILIGIGVSAILQSAVAYLLAMAPAWSRQDAMRWLTGSVNGAQPTDSLPLLAALAVFGTVLFWKARDLEVLRLGDEAAAGLGTDLAATRLLATLAAVALVSFATATSGPIAFVAFLAGPIATRLTGTGTRLLLPAGLVGAVLVLAGDYGGQHFLPNRYPVGVVTGALGAPFLIYLLVRANRHGRSA